MFNKDIHNYIGPDGELTEEVAIELYGRVHGEHPGIFDGCFTAIRVFILTFFSCAVFSCLGMITLAFIVDALNSALGSDKSIAPTATVIPVQHQQEIPSLQFVRCILPYQERIIFNARSDGIWNLYAISADNPQETCQLSSNNNTHVTNPSRSPDGEKVAYEYQSSGMIGILDLPSNNTQFLQGTNILSAPAWSPDGNRLIVQTDTSRECTNLLTIWLDNISYRVTDGSTCDITPDWSPDGNKIVFARADNNRVDLEIFVLDLTTSEFTQLTDNALQDYGPVWSPDSSQIAFASEDGIYIIDPYGENLRRVIEYGQWPTWSPDGSRLAFVSNYGNTEGTATALFITNADGTEITRITDYINAMHPDWG